MSTNSWKPVGQKRSVILESKNSVRHTVAESLTKPSCVRSVQRQNSTHRHIHGGHVIEGERRMERTACDTTSPESISKPSVHHEAQRQCGLGHHVHGGHAELFEQEQREGNAAQAAGLGPKIPPREGGLPSRTPSTTHFLCVAFLAIGLAAASSARSPAAAPSPVTSWACCCSLMRSAAGSRMKERICAVHSSKSASGVGALDEADAAQVTASAEAMHTST